MRSPSASSLHDKNLVLEGRTITDLAQAMGKHVADVMLDLAVEEGLETEFSPSRPAHGK